MANATNTTNAMISMVLLAYLSWRLAHATDATAGSGGESKLLAVVVNAAVLKGVAASGHLAPMTSGAAPPCRAVRQRGAQPIAAPPMPE